MTPPACCCTPAPASGRRSISAAGAWAAAKLLLLSIDGTDRWMDSRLLHRPCIITRCPPNSSEALVGQGRKNDFHVSVPQTLVTPLIPGRGQLAPSLKQRGLGERCKLPQCGTPATESTFSLLTFSVTTRLEKTYKNWFLFDNVEASHAC